MSEILERPATQDTTASSLLSHDGELMGELLRRARAAWPGVDVAPEVFASYVISRLPVGVEPEATLRRMRTCDLYLACACAGGDPRAIAAFERRCLGVVGEALLRMEGVDAAMADDVKQQLRRGLLVGDAGRPGILDFSGRGELRRWLQVLAVRRAVALRRRARREMPSEDWLLERALVPAEDPEMAYLKSFYRREVAEAIAQALLALSAHERTLLRQSFVDGLSIDALAALHGIHRATAARWLARAQKSLSKETRALLTRRLKVQPAELRSILGLIRSGLQLSLRVLFARHRRRRTRAIARELRSS